MWSCESFHVTDRSPFEPVFSTARFLSKDAIVNPIFGAHWSTLTGYSGVLYESIVETPTVFPLHRVEWAYGSIEEVAINGHPAVVLTGDGFETISWNDGQRTTIVTGYHVPADVVIDAANALTPASVFEWQRMQFEAVTGG
jgi:hypothetical protein